MNTFELIGWSMTLLFALLLGAIFALAGYMAWLLIRDNRRVNRLIRLVK